MKKISLLLVVLGFMFALVACEDNTGTTTVDEVKPVIEGVSTAEITIGGTFDPLDGVTATDDVDGDLTSAIVVSGDTVNTNRAGDYIVVYTVSDAAGNEAVKQRVVSVKGLAGFANGDFADGLDGWSNWVNESQGVAATFEASDGVATIDITEQSVVNDNNWWDVQLSQKTLELKSFESYTLKFTVSAENARKMIVQIQGGGLSSKPINERIIDVTTEDVTYSIDFFATEDSAGTELQFALGTFHKVDGVPSEQQTVLGKVYISDVQIIAGPELENQAPTLDVTTNILLPVGATNFLVKGGITVDDDVDDLTIDDVTYTDTSDVKFVIGQPAVKGTYTFEYSVTDSEGETTTATRVLHVADAFDLPGFDNVDQTTSVPVGWETWYEETRGGMNVSTSDGVVEIELTNIDSVSGNIWENQFKIQNLAAFSGEYRLSFQAKADVARSMVVAMEGNGGVDLENISFDQALTTEWNTYTFDFSVNVDATIMNRNLQFWFGSLVNREGFTAADDILTTIYLKNVSINKTADIDYGDELAFEYQQGFYADNATEISSDADALFNKYIVVDPIPKGLLPVGSSIMIEEGYQYRVIFLEKTETGFKVVNRSGNFTSAYQYVNESFWGDYKYISFNISTTPTTDISSRIDEVADMLTLYHPAGTMDQHIDYELEWSNGYIEANDTAITASDNFLITNPLTPNYYNLDTVVSVADGYKMAYVVYSFENDVYTATFVSDYMTEELWVNEDFASDKDLIGFIVTTTTEDQAIDLADVDTIVEMHPNTVDHLDMELNFITGYWADNATKIATGTTDFHKKYAASNILSKHYFDLVSEIIVPDGYTLKPIFLSYDGYGNYQVVERLDALTGVITLDDTFWSTHEYIAFNYSKVDGTDISGELDQLAEKLSFTVDEMTFITGYWAGNATEISTGDTDFHKKYAASNVIPRQFLQSGTVITIADGYKLKAIFLSYTEDAGYKVMFRTGEYENELLLTDAMFKDYQYIAFNMSLVTGSDVSGELATLPSKLTFAMFSDTLIDHVDGTLDFEMGYWADNATEISYNESDFDKGFAASNVLSKAYFDGKTSIQVADGYKIKVIYMAYDHNTYTVLERTGYLNGTVTLDESFWQEYEYIAFNISSDPSSDLTSVVDTLESQISFIES